MCQWDSFQWFGSKRSDWHYSTCCHSYHYSILRYSIRHSSMRLLASSRASSLDGASACVDTRSDPRSRSIDCRCPSDSHLVPSNIVLCHSNSDSDHNHNTQIPMKRLIAWWLRLSVALTWSDVCIWLRRIVCSLLSHRRGRCAAAQNFAAKFVHPRAAADKTIIA